MALGWILFIFISIWREPEPGAGSPQDLADAFSKALVAGDVDQATLLLKFDPGKDVVRQTLADAKCSASPSVTAEERDDHWYIVITGEAGRLCGELPASDQDGRWYIDLWADPLCLWPSG